MDKKLVALMSLFFVAFLFFTTLVVFKNPLSTITRAEKAAQPSGANSLIFAWPLNVKADGQSEVKIDVFVRSETNGPLENKTVAVNTTLGNLKVLDATSDKEGKTTFSLNSNTPGVAELTATIDNTLPLTQKLTIKFE